jgi:RNA polymerase sigma-70 factor (ECF subfamily)
MIGAEFPAVLREARGGGDAAFARMWRELQPPLLRYLRVVAGDGADDVAADTWATVATSLQRFEGDEDAFRAWFFTVARRRAVDHFRREARRPATPVDPAVLRVASFAAIESDPLEATLTAHSTQAALMLVAQLPRDQAEAVTLRSVAGLDVAEVAAIMQKRPGTVRVLAHRGLRELARRLSEEAHTVRA